MSAKKTNTDWGSSEILLSNMLEIDALIALLDRKGLLNKAEVLADVPAISTGSLELDLALGVGGFPRGRVIEIFGPEASGKTTLSLHAIAEAQKLAREWKPRK